MAEEDSTSSSTESESTPRAFRFAQAVLSDVGLKREENQDSYGFAHTDLISFYIVADGMGGARGGGTASALAIDTVLRNAFDSDGMITEDSLRSAIELANEVIFERSRADLSLSGMGTTLVALAFIGSRAIVAHVGDSRIYCYRQGELIQLTRDHTLVQELVDSGAIRPEDAAHHPIAHMLTRSLGPASNVQVDVRTIEFEVSPGERFLLCSDGMYNLVDGDELAGIFGKDPADEAIQKILELVLERGASDNTTIEIIHVHELQDESIEFAIPDPGKIRVVTSGEIPEFEPESSDEEIDEEIDGDTAGEIAGEVDSDSEVEPAPVERIENVVALEPLIHSTDSSLQAVDSFVESTESEDESLEDDAEFVESADLSEEDESIDGATEFAVDSGTDSTSEVDDTWQTFTASHKAETFPHLSSVEDLDAELSTDSPISTAAASRITPAVRYAIVAAVGMSMGVLTLVLSSDPQTALRVNSGEAPGEEKKVTEPTQVAGTTKQPVSSSDATTPSGPRSGAASRPSDIPSFTQASPDAQKLFSPPPPLFEDNSKTSRPLPSSPDEEKQASDNNASGRDTEQLLAGTPQGAGWPAVDVGNVDSSSKAPEVTTVITELNTSEEMEDGEGELPSAGPIAPGSEEVVILASSREIPPIPRVSSTKKPEVAPINWAKERQMREALNSETAGEILPPRYLSDEERREVLNRKIDVRESIADLDTKLVALGTHNRDELDALYASVSRQLSNAQKASDQVNGELERTRAELQRWRERKQTAISGAFRLAPELVPLDPVIRAKKSEYDQLLLKYRAAVESWQLDPRDMSRVSQMSLLAREQKSMQAELETVVQNTIEKAIDDLEEKVIGLTIAAKDLEIFVRRLSRHLGFVRGAQPNTGNANASILDRTARERERLTTEFDQLNTQLSEYAENELRRKSVFASKAK